MFWNDFEVFMISNKSNNSLAVLEICNPDVIYDPLKKKKRKRKKKGNFITFIALPRLSIVSWYIRVFDYLQYSGMRTCTTEGYDVTFLNFNSSIISSSLIAGPSFSPMYDMIISRVNSSRAFPSISWEKIGTKKWNKGRVLLGLFGNRNSWNKPNNCSFSGYSDSRVTVKPS